MKKMRNMWFAKKNCNICHKHLPMSELLEYETMGGSTILCCNMCMVYFKTKKREKEWY